MDLSSILEFAGGIAYICYTIYRTNHDQLIGERNGTLLRWLLYGVVIVTAFYALFIFQLAAVSPTMVAPPTADLSLPSIDLTWAAINLALTALFSLFSIGVITSPDFRQRIRLLLPASATYDPESPVHTTAWVLVLALISRVIAIFVVGGGISGMAETLEASGVALSDILFENVLWVLAATLGVGLFLRRTPQAALTRLGLRFPTVQDFRWGSGVGALLFGFVIILSRVWAGSVSPQELEQQTAASSQLAQAFNSLPLALLLSVIVAIGEEVFFRGALQPVFGNVLTTIMFTALHTQYTLTPATILIVATSLSLGWLRTRYSTSASIIGHFVYNFSQLAIAVMVGTSV